MKYEHLTSLHFQKLVLIKYLNIIKKCFQAKIKILYSALIVGVEIYNRKYLNSQFDSNFDHNEKFHH